MRKKTLVILSGGQDSTTCLFWAIDKFGKENVESLTFDYGQKHKIEIKSAQKIAEYAQINNKIISINTFSEFANNALLNNEISIESNVNNSSALPNTFVPGRNLIFITYAAAYAWNKNILDLITGVAQIDYSGYPDCRNETILSLEKTISLGMDCSFKIHTPLINLSKKEIVELAVSLGILDVLGMTHTCYLGVYPPCESCMACKLRKKGFEEAGIKDPLVKK